MTGRAASSVAEVLGLYEALGHDPYDEVVSQLDHALQAAALARSEEADDSLVAACLLHDVGHLLVLRDAGAGPGQPADTSRDLRHEDTGAAWLRPLFPPAVTAPIALHVRAKRYLCAVDRTYFATLSEGSRRSLALQGGPMDPAEVASFEALASFREGVWLRRWDDAAKVVGLPVEPLVTYTGLLSRLARA